MRQEGTSGTGNRDFEWQLHLGIGGKFNKNQNEIFRGKIAKQVVGTSIGLRTMTDWTLWRGQPAPERKKTY
jgi:hypothetical protein